MEKPRQLLATHYIIPSFKILRLAKGRVMGSKVDTGTLRYSLKPAPWKYC